MSDTDYATTRKDGLMWSQCWCMGSTVLVTPADVRAGRTGSCGEYCRPRPGPSCEWRNRIRLDEPELRITIVSGDNVKAPATHERPGASASPSEQEPTHER